MKKLLALLLAAVMTLALAACGGGNAGNAGNAGSAGADAGSNAGSSAPEDGGDAAAYLVGICQYAPPLNQNSGSGDKLCRGIWAELGKS